MIQATDRHAATCIRVVGALVLTACVAGHTPLASWHQPRELSREWIDIDKSTPTDTTLWVLRADGYDGVAHLLSSPDSSGVSRVSRKEVRYGSWYLDGTMGDTTHEALCISRRSGRIGATCTAFVLDTIMVGSVATPRLVLRAYHGNTHVRDRHLLARTAVQP